MGLSWWSVAKNLPYNAGDVGSILDQGTKIPNISEQLSPRATLLKPTALEPASPGTAIKAPAGYNKDLTSCNSDLTQGK